MASDQSANNSHRTGLLEPVVGGLASRGDFGAMAVLRSASYQRLDAGYHRLHER